MIIRNIIILEYEVHGIVPHTGKSYDNRFCSIITIENRKIICSLVGRPVSEQLLAPVVYPPGWRSRKQPTDYPLLKALPKIPFPRGPIPNIAAFFMKLDSLPDAHGHFGPYGGMFVPETLMTALNDLTAEYARARKDPAFQRELDSLLADFAGRPTPLYFAERLTQLEQLSKKLGQKFIKCCTTDNPVQCLR